MVKNWKKYNIPANTVPGSDGIQTEVTVIVKSTRMKIKDLIRITDLISETFGVLDYSPEILKIDTRTSTSSENGTEVSRSVVLSLGSLPKDSNPKEETE